MLVCTGYVSGIISLVEEQLVCKHFIEMVIDAGTVFFYFLENCTRVCFGRHASLQAALSGICVRIAIEMEAEIDKVTRRGVGRAVVYWGVVALEAPLVVLPRVEHVIHVRGQSIERGLAVCSEEVSRRGVSGRLAQRRTSQFVMSRFDQAESGVVDIHRVQMPTDIATGNPGFQTSLGIHLHGIVVQAIHVILYTDWVQYKPTSVRNTEYTQYRSYLYGPLN